MPLKLKKRDIRSFLNSLSGRISHNAMINGASKPAKLVMPVSISSFPVKGVRWLKYALRNHKAQGMAMERM
jgi:hypothetical protein